MVYNFTEEGEPAANLITDNVKDYNPKENFDALNSSIACPLSWKNNVLSLNNNSQINEVNICFGSYGF